MAHGREQEELWESHKKPFPALSAWALSYSLRSQVAAAIRKMFALGLDDQVETNMSFQMS